MEHVDLPKLNRGELTQVRRQVVRLKKIGNPGKEIEESTGVRQNRIITPESEHRKSGYAERKRRPYQSNVVRYA